MIIGLTGGIASGKSTVAKMLKEKGAHLLDADVLAREAVEPEQPAWREIVDWLGESILLPDRNIDRAKLAGLVFNDRRMLEKLNHIVHPWVGARFMEQAETLKQQDPHGVIVYDVPLLIEAGLKRAVDCVLLVHVPRDTQIARLQQRDGLSRSQAEARLNSQLPLDEKKKHADYTIDNRGTQVETARQVDRFWKEQVSSRTKRL